MLLLFLMDTYIFFRMCDLFDQTIRYAARALGYTYDKAFAYNDFSLLNVAEKQEIMLKSIVLDAENSLVSTLSRSYADCVKAMFLSRYVLSLFISSGDTTKFCTSTAAQLPTSPTITIMSGTESTVLSFFLFTPMAKNTAPITERTASALYTQIVMFTSVYPAP